MLPTSESSHAPRGHLCRKLQCFPALHSRRGASVDNVTEKKKNVFTVGQQRHGFDVKCVGDGTLNHPAPQVWKTSVIYASGVVLFPHPPPEHTCEVGDPDSSGKHYYLFWRECIIIKMK